WFLFDTFIYATFAVVSMPDPVPTSAPDPDKYVEQFSVRKGNAHHIVRVDSINWIEAQGYYAGLHTDDGLFLLRKSLNSLGSELDPKKFVRVHRSTIVRIDQVEKVQSDTGGAASISLRRGQNRKVSREGLRRLKTALGTAQIAH
ncbi:MAG: LytTR family DNA-binding domain-containing protein, partial [Planctomycetota bacterium]